MIFNHYIELAGSAGVAGRAHISNVGVKNIGLAGYASFTR